MLSIIIKFKRENKNQNKNNIIKLQHYRERNTKKAPTTKNNFSFVWMRNLNQVKMNERTRKKNVYIVLIVWVIWSREDVFLGKSGTKLPV